MPLLTAEQEIWLATQMQALRVLERLNPVSYTHLSAHLRYNPPSDQTHRSVIVALPCQGSENLCNLCNLWFLSLQ